MKRTCCTHKDAQFVCISDHCLQNCSYICSIPYDQCKQLHESCNLVSLNYLTKKCTKIVNKQKSLSMKELQKVYDQNKVIMQRFESFFSQKQNAQKVKDLLDPHGLIEKEQKQFLIKFIQNDRKQKLNPAEDISSSWIQKQLLNLSIQINSYLKFIKDDKRQLKQDVVFRENQSPIRQSRTKAVIRQRQNQKKQNTDAYKIRSLSKGPTLVRGSNNQVQSPSKVSRASRVVNGMSSTNGFQVKLSSVIKNHVPIGPLFSKITNNIETIQTFFYQKFSGASLLYRASQNGFLTSKFHQKCDGVKDTLTIVITEQDKIIGGYTPLPWRSSGDWYQDDTQASFIFSLTSGERFPLLNKSKAIWCNHAYGPSFGYPDLEIANKAFYNQNSCVNFPQFYNNGNYTHSSKSIEFLCGTKTGHFRIKQWEVYQLQF